MESLIQRTHSDELQVHVSIYQNLKLESQTHHLRLVQSASNLLNQIEQILLKCYSG
jgi:hypothetical protein